MVTNCARVTFAAGSKVVALVPETTPASYICLMYE